MSCELVVGRVWLQRDAPVYFAVRVFPQFLALLRAHALLGGAIVVNVAVVAGTLPLLCAQLFGLEDDPVALVFLDALGVRLLAIPVVHQILVPAAVKVSLRHALVETPVRSRGDPHTFHRVANAKYPSSFVMQVVGETHLISVIPPYTGSNIMVLS